MKIVLLDTATLGEDIDLSPLYAAGQVTEYKKTAPDEVAERIGEAEVLVLNKIKMGAHNLSAAPRLRLICVTSTGYDTIDIEYCRSRGIALYNVPGYSTDSVAQVTLAMALSLVSHLSEYRAFVGSGAYTASGLANRLTPVYHELSALTFGVVGGGAIGSRVAELAKGFGCRVLLCRRKPDDRYEQADMDSLCRKADILSLHVPLTEETRGMLSRERIAAMKQGAIVINMARGAVADEQALADAIQSGHLGGLGADVYSAEPFGETHPFFAIRNRDNVCLTPHMAWGSAEARGRCLAAIAENIRRFEQNDPTCRIV